MKTAHTIIQYLLALLTVMTCSAYSIPYASYYKKLKRYFYPKPINAQYVGPHAEWETHNYFDTAFLLDTHTTHHALIKDGFQEISLITEDNITLSGLWRGRSDAVATIIVCQGRSDLKECMAPLTLMIPENYNILLFDRQDSGTVLSPQFLTCHYQYGLYLYKDILAALNFAHTQSTAPIVFHAFSIGTFHTIKALQKLKENNKLHTYPIQGIIFDSGISSMQSAAQNLPASITKKITGRSPQDRRPRSYFAINPIPVYHLAAFVVGIGHRILDVPTNEHIKDIMPNLDIPLLYIHALYDVYPIKPIQEIAQKSKNASEWWISGSGHANHHLKYKYEYTHKLNEFLSSLF